MLKIIMVSGYKNSGKDFVSDLLVKKIDGAKKMAFAEPLKDIIATTFGITTDELDEYKNKDEELLLIDPNSEPYDECYTKPLTDFRKVLQRFGTEAMKKHFGQDVWVDLLKSKLPEDGTVIISDWRFKQEYLKLYTTAWVNVTTLRVDNFNLVGDGHISEHELDDFKFDYRINNTKQDKSVLIAVEDFLAAR